MSNVFIIKVNYVIKFKLFFTTIYFQTNSDKNDASNDLKFGENSEGNIIDDVQTKHSNKKTIRFADQEQEKDDIADVDTLDKLYQLEECERKMRENTQKALELVDRLRELEQQQNRERRNASDNHGSKGHDNLEPEKVFDSKRDELDGYEAETRQTAVLNSFYVPNEGFIRLKIS